MVFIFQVLHCWFLGAFTKLWKANISFIKSVCLSICSHGTTLFPRDGFSWNFIFEYFLEMSRKCIFHENLTRITGTLHEDQYTFVIITHSVLLRMRNVLDKICRGNQNTYFTFNNFFFFQKSCHLWDNVKKHCRAEQATDENIVHAHCILDT